MQSCYHSNIHQIKITTIVSYDNSPMPSPTAVPVFDTSKWLEDFFMLLYRSMPAQMPASARAGALTQIAQWQ